MFLTYTVSISQLIHNVYTLEDENMIHYLGSLSILQYIFKHINHAARERYNICLKRKRSVQKLFDMNASQPSLYMYYVSRVQAGHVATKLIDSR